MRHIYGTLLVVPLRTRLPWQGIDLVGLSQNHQRGHLVQRNNSIKDPQTHRPIQAMRPETYLLGGQL